jgi:S1-C subfamily serine protease
MAKSIMQQILEYGDVKRGVLGVGAQNITPDLASAFHLNDTKGAAITQIIPGSPAQQSGLEVGDIIKSINGEPVKNASDVVNTIGFLRVDSKINVNIIRNNKPLDINVTLSDPKKRQEQIAAANPYLYGLTLKDFTLLSPIHGNVEGILVVAIDPDSKAWQYDLQPGDVIKMANNVRVKNIEELKAVVAKAGNTLLLNVLRGSSAVFLVINKTDEQ